MLTAAVRDLKAAYPTWEIGAATTNQYLWDNNPNITYFDDPGSIGYQYVGYETPRMLKFEDCSHHFAHAFQRTLNRQLNISIPLGKPVGDVYLSVNEFEPLIKSSKPVLLVNAGYKDDIPVKQWPIDRFQQTVDELKELYTIVQIGRQSTMEHHPELDGVISMIDETPGRKIIQLMVQADAVLTGVSFPMHLCASVTEKDRKQRKCVVLAGGREEPSWEQYDGHIYLNSLGKLNCCQEHGCWRKLLKPSNTPKDMVCLNQIRADKMHYRPQCMVDISVKEVVDALSY